MLFKIIFVFKSSKVSPTFKFVMISLENKLLNKMLKINKLNPKWAIFWEILLNFFIKNPKRVYSREQLLENVWSENINVETRTIDVHIRRLRQNINLKGSKELIRTVRSAGYSLD